MALLRVRLAETMSTTHDTMARARRGHKQQPKWVAIVDPAFIMCWYRDAWPYSIWHTHQAGFGHLSSARIFLRAIPQYKKSLWILTPCVELRSYFEPSLAAHKKLHKSFHSDFVDELTLHEVLPPPTRHVFLRNLHVRPLKQKRLRQV